MLDSLLDEVESLQEEVDVKLLAHLSFAVQPPLHLFPLFAASHPRTYLVYPEENKCEDVEIGKVNLFISVLEKLRCDAISCKGTFNIIVHVLVFTLAR